MVTKLRFMNNRLFGLEARKWKRKRISSPCCEFPWNHSRKLLCLRVLSAARCEQREPRAPLCKPPDQLRSIKFALAVSIRIPILDSVAGQWNFQRAEHDLMYGIPGRNKHNLHDLLQCGNSRCGGERTENGVLLDSSHWYTPTRHCPHLGRKR